MEAATPVDAQPKEEASATARVIVSPAIARTIRPVPLAKAGGPRREYTAIEYIQLLRSHYLTASVPAHVAELVNKFRDENSVVAYIDADAELAIAECRSGIPEATLEEIASRLSAVAGKLDSIDPEWADRIRYYESEVRKYL